MKVRGTKKRLLMKNLSLKYSPAIMIDLNSDLMMVLTILIF